MRWLLLDGAILARIRNETVQPLHSPPATPRQPPLILVVEDEPTNQAILQTVVEDFIGARALLAGDGQEALAAVRGERPDLIILDLMMPVLDGFAVAQQLKGNPETAAIPIIALTAMARQQDEEAAFRAGCDAYLAKPFDLVTVEVAIRARLRPDQGGSLPRADGQG